MTTVGEIYDELAAGSQDTAEDFKNQMIVAMMGTDTAFTAKGVAGMREVASTWDAQRALAKQLKNPAIRAMALSMLASELTASELGVIVDDQGVPSGVDAVLSTEDDDADAEEPSFA